MDALFHWMARERMLVSALVLLGLLAGEAGAPFFGVLRAHRRAWGRHLLRNLALGTLNGLLVSGLFVVLWTRVAAWAESARFGLLNLSALPLWAHALGAFLLLDLFTYGWHRANHRMPLLWRFHRVHHSDAHMDVTTAYRFHFGEIVLSSVLRLGVLALGGIKLWELALYELLMFPVVQLHHADIGLPPRVDRLLRIFLATPAMHKIHHSRVQAETDSNYTSCLSVWDRLLGSFRMRPHLEELRLGLDGFDTPGDQTLSGLLRAPFRT